VIDRRTFLGVLTGGLLAAPLAAEGQQAGHVYRVGYLSSSATIMIMPRLNGTELARHIRQELPEASVVLMSSYTEDAYRLMASDGDAVAFVNKHVMTSSLVPAVLDVIRRRGGGSGGPLPPFIGGSSASAVYPP
jgi:DNA-binding NarL/FixJ family response regulator